MGDNDFDINDVSRFAAGSVISSAQKTAIPCNELTTVKFKEDCFACNFINTFSMKKNPVFLQLMHVYTDNVVSSTRDSLWNMVKQYYEEHVRPILPAHVPIWTIDCIAEHFMEHTQYPTDEILNQINIKKGIRRHIVNSLVYKSDKSESEKIFDERNIKLLIQIDKEISRLYLSKSDISKMVGYCEVLDY